MPGRTVTLILSVCIAVALGCSGYLLWADLTSSPIAGCGGGGGWIDCDSVSSSRWSIWFGIPVSLFAIGIYLVMAAALVAGSTQRCSRSVRKVGWTVVTVTALAAGLSAIWFVGIQFLVLKHICVYCMTAHVCGLVAAGTMLAKSPLRGKAMAATASLSLAGLAILVGGQFLTTPPETYRIERFEVPAKTESDGFEFAPPSSISPELTAPGEESSGDDLFEAPITTHRQTRTPLSEFVAKYIPNQPILLDPTMVVSAIVADEGAKPAEASPRIAAIQGGTIKLNLAQWPHLGRDDAKYVVVEVFDYYCPSCRETYAAVAGAREKLGDDLAVMLLPVPLNAACNSSIRITNPMYRESCEVTSLAIAVWRVDPAAFEEFHNWMLQSKTPPTYAAAKAKVASLVDAEKINAELSSGTPGKYIAKHVEIYNRVGKGTIPKLMFPQTSVVGKFTSADSLVELIRREGA
ncbi:vitamin K epoxide reductase family protein [Novipirellula aureliae]|uniref:vitamin K epoxide reductase family protein n=1 Tax=Novipirellula aureliae TaxID=2527966 RepID=UPI0018CEA42D|nr:vitamin K epoxide reductase family protein [Novipirellula aureliae]